MIAASRCPECERLASPPETRCLACRTRTVETELPAEGAVLTFVPVDEHWVALVELEGGARVLARAEAEPAIDERVSLRQAGDGYRLEA